MSRLKLIAAVAAATAVLVMAVALGRPPSTPVQSPSASLVAEASAGLEKAPADSNVSVEETRAWLVRARSDAAAGGVTNVDVLVPLNVIVADGITFVWFRDYDSGDQVMAQYDGAEVDTASLVGVFAPSPKTVEVSTWERERISSAIASDAHVQTIVGAPVSVLGVGTGPCPTGPGVCARVRLAGSRLAAPSDGPALAPVAFVNLRTLAVSLVLPD